MKQLLTLFLVCSLSYCKAQDTTRLRRYMDSTVYYQRLFERLSDSTKAVFIKYDYWWQRLDSVLKADPMLKSYYKQRKLNR